MIQIINRFSLDKNGIYNQMKSQVIESSGSGGAGEFHPHAPTDPDVSVSRHPALIIQPPK